MATPRTPPRLSGRALRAAVAAAESPMVGRSFKQLMFRQLGLEALMDVDLSGTDVTPTTLPSPHPPTGAETREDHGTADVSSPDRA